MQAARNNEIAGVEVQSRTIRITLAILQQSDMRLTSYRQFRVREQRYFPYAPGGGTTELMKMASPSAKKIDRRVGDVEIQEEERAN
jgi:hypothetical protein